MSAGSIHIEVDKLYKQSFGGLLKSLLYKFPGLEFEEAEDIVQESFSSALVHWQGGNLPQNPVGWLYQVCRNKAINILKSKNRFAQAMAEVELGEEQEFGNETRIRDLTLNMLFACAHPRLAPKTQTILVLKYVMNLKVEAIAKAFAMTIDGVDKLLLRGRHSIKSNNIKLEVTSEVEDRLPVVHRMIYLIFNEGYKASYGRELVREELCEEALILCKELLDAGIGDADSKALYALLLFNSARLQSRFNAEGKLVDLENQDRSLWDKDLIELGSYYLSRSRVEPAGSFHLEASIAFLHCISPSFERTDWSLITQLYSKLLGLSKNPFLELNYAVALFYAGMREKAFLIANELLRQPFFHQYYLLNATLGKFYLLQGEKGLAKEYFLKAIHQTHFEIEREFIQEMLAKAS